MGTNETGKDMYKIRHSINYWATILLQIFYMYLGCKINLKYSYDDVWELGLEFWLQR